MQVRDYRESDLADCAVCFSEGFFSCETNVADRDFLKGYTQIMIEKSNFTLVAEEDDKVVGFLCGMYTPSFRKHLAKHRCCRRHYGMWVAFLLKYFFTLGRLSKPLKAQYDVFFAALKQRPGKKEMACDCELAALTSRKAYRKGLGTALVNAMMERCRAEGARTSRLFTNTLSTWRFYDKYGFRRVYEAKSTTRLFSGESFVYEYSIV